MGEHSNGFDQNGRGTLNPPEMDIPVLKKQEKEKKGLGAILPGAAQGAGGVAGGAGVGQAGGFMALFAGKAGLAALALGVVGAGAIGVGLMGGGQGPKKAASPQLDGLASNINVGQRNAKGSKSLSYMEQAGAGQLKWENPNAPKPEASPESKSDAPADTPAESVAESGEGADTEESNKPRLSGGLSGAKLSSSLGGSGAFGKNNIFQKGSGFNMKSSDLKSKSGIAGGASRLGAASKGNLSGKMRGKNSLMAGGRSTSRIKGNGALGQLKFAGTRSQAASKAGESGAASTFAADAFDQQKTTGGTLETGAGGIGDGVGTVNPAGGSAPDVTGGDGTCPEGWGAAGEGGGCTPPDITNGVDQTKYQGLLDGVLQMQKAAQQMMMIGTALIVLGAIIMATTSWMGIGTLIGGALIAAGLAMVVMAQMMNKQADQMADQIGSMYQQKKQADVLKARGEGDSSTPELEQRRIEQQKEAAQGPGFTEEETKGPATEPLQ